MEMLILAGVIWLFYILHNSLYRRFLFKGFTYRCYFTKQEVYEGDDLELVEELTNSKWLPIPWLKTDFNLPKHLEIAGTRSVVTDKTRFFSSFFLLKGRHSLTRSWKVHCAGRGIFPIDKAVAVATDLLGNQVQSKSFQMNISLTVLPSPVSADMPNFNPVQLTGFVPVRRSLTQNPFELVGTREYTDRDPMNKIDWLATARTRTLMVRETAFSASPRLAILLNIQSRDGERDYVLDDNLVESAIRICAGLFYQTVSEDIPFKFYCNVSLFDDYVRTPLDSGMAHVLEHLRLLAALPLCNSRDFPTFLAQYKDELLGLDVVVVTVYMSEKLNESLLLLEHPTVFTMGTSEVAYPSNCDVYSFCENGNEVAQ